MPASKRKVDFRKVKDRGNFRVKHLPEGDYHARVHAVDDHESGAGNEGWVFTIGPVKGSSAAQKARYPYYTMLEAKQAWKIRNLFLAAGIKVPKKLLAVDPNKLVGKDIGITLEDDEYEGKMRSTIADVFPLDELIDDEADDFDEDEDEEIEEEDEDEDEDEEEEKPRKKSKKKVVDDEDDEVDDEELEEIEIEEL